MEELSAMMKKNIHTLNSHEDSGSNAGRLSVDEYFDELWSMYLKKHENLQA